MKWRMELRDYSYRYLSATAEAPRNPVSGSGGIMAAAPEDLAGGRCRCGLARVMGRRLRREIGL